MSKINKPRLGRGLSSLISVSDDLSELTPAPSMLADSDQQIAGAARGIESVPVTQRVLDIDVNHIKSNPYQPRKEFTAQSIMDLAASLKTNGVIQPIVVRASWPGVRAGRRRTPTESSETGGVNYGPCDR